MSKRTVLTTITPLPPGITRETVLETLYNHVEMIDLNPLVESRTPMAKPPARASAEEYHCAWYELVDKIQYLPGGLYSGRVTYHACFNDLADGVQTRIYAPLGLVIKERWSVGGNLPGEPRQRTEIGLGMPKDGLWLREDCDMKCNILATSFVKKNLTRSHKVLVDRLIEKAELRERDAYNESLASASVSSPTSSIAATDRFSRLRMVSSQHSLQESFDTQYGYGQRFPHTGKPVELPDMLERAELPANEEVMRYPPYDPQSYERYGSLKQSIPPPRAIPPPAVPEKPPKLSIFPSPTEYRPVVPERPLRLQFSYEKAPRVPEKSPMRDSGISQHSGEWERRTCSRDLVYP